MSAARELARKRWDNRPALPEPTTQGGRLRAARLAKGWTLAQLGAKTGILPATIGYYERDRFVPPPERLEAFVVALGVSAEMLIGGG